MGIEMRLLILSNYFTPDLSAGSFRMQALVDSLQTWSQKGLEVDLVTTQPNRYASHSVDAPGYEDRGWLRVHRIKLPAHKGGMIDQSSAYLRYILGVRRVVRGRRWDLVFATSSRLMTARLGAHVAQKMNAPLYLDIRDLFTDNMQELLSGGPLKLLQPIFRRAEKKAFRSASCINVVSEGFVKHVNAIAPDVPVRVFTNGIDGIFLKTDFSNTFGNNSLPLIVYAGNMGEGQGLHRIVPEVAGRMFGKAKFRFIGDGGRRKVFENELSLNDVSNVEIMPPVDRASLLDQYCRADILFLHLNDLDAFKKVLPSKIFEYGATGKPILAGVSGYAAEFLKINIPDAEIFSPLDVDGMSEAITRLEKGQSMMDRSHFRKQFSRKNIMDEMARDIVMCAKI